MARKILVGIVSVALTIMVLCMGMIMSVVYDYLGTQIDYALVNQAHLVEAGIEGGGQEYLESLKNEYTLKSRVTVIDKDGNVLFDNEADSLTMENHLQREEVQEALESGEGFAVRDSSTMATNTRYYAHTMDDGNILRVSTSQFSHIGLLFDTSGLILGTGLILIILSLVISRKVAMIIIKPINDIDLNDPQFDKNYEEIEPLLYRIHQQNEKIANQIENLRRKNEEFSIIIENMSEGLVIIDNNYEVLTFNSSALSILGADPQVIQQSEVLNVFSLNRSEPFRNAVEESLKGHKSETHLSMGTDTYEILGSPVYSEGNVTGSILIIMDVTEKEVGERMRREFTSNVSHELKTPLTSIFGVSDMLASGIVKPEDVGQFALTIKEESSRLISLIDDIMQISRLDETSGIQEKEIINLTEIAEAVTARLQSKAAEKNVTLTFAGQAAEVKGVDYILDEIVYNLCENAIKYNKQNGTVSVRVEKQLGCVLLRVADTGIGIPKDDLERVFERFYRADKSHNKDIPGTGLGLSIVKHGVAYHDGEITLDSREGIGTTVVVKMPMA